MIQTSTQMMRPKFPIGERVRVRNHVMDPDYPELPLGGWVGEVADVQRKTIVSYLVRWSGDTLKSIHPVYRDRCQRDNLCVDQIWLLEADLEPDRGEPLSIAHPINAARPAGTTSRSIRPGAN